jgi:hypothetical protein
MDLVSNLVVFEHVNSYNLESINFKCKLFVIAKVELITQGNDQLINIWKEHELEIGGIV